MKAATNRVLQIETNSNTPNSQQPYDFTPRAGAVHYIKN
jgi:hypothetical protein